MSTLGRQPTTPERPGDMPQLPPDPSAPVGPNDIPNVNPDDERRYKGEPAEDIAVQVDTDDTNDPDADASGDSADEAPGENQAPEEWSEGEK